MLEQKKQKLDDKGVGIVRATRLRDGINEILNEHAPQFGTCRRDSSFLTQDDGAGDVAEVPLSPGQHEVGLAIAAATEGFAHGFINGGGFGGMVVKADIVVSLTPSRWRKNDF